MFIYHSNLKPYHERSAKNGVYGNYEDDSFKLTILNKYLFYNERISIKI
jgi:hypothetical protein